MSIIANLAVKTRSIPPPGAQVSLTFKPLPGENPGEFSRRILRELQASRVGTLLMLVYGRLDACAIFCDALRRSNIRLDWPVTWVEGASCNGAAIAGVQIFGFTGRIERIYEAGRPVASVFTESGLRHCVAGGLSPMAAGSVGDQTAVTLEALERIVQRAGFSMADVIRTWFFLDDILAWYDEFNRVRNRIYSGIKFRTGSLPASTGVGARNPNRSALSLAAWAVQPVEAGCGAAEIASPLQCPAPAYGSSFSRAMEITGTHGRQLFISGTASIAPGGHTVWLGDVTRQIELTMDVVEAILKSRRMTLADISRATAYFKHPADAAVFTAWLASHKVLIPSTVATHCAVCRDDLLFELEADAIAPL